MIAYRTDGHRVYGAVIRDKRAAASRDEYWELQWLNACTDARRRAVKRPVRRKRRARRGWWVSFLIPFCILLLTVGAVLVQHVPLWAALIPAFVALGLGVAFL